MDSKEFRNYVTDQRRIGLNDTQIARNLGMDVGIFKDAVKFAFNNITEPVTVKKEKAENNILQKEVKPIEKPVSGAAEPKREFKKKIEGITYVPQNDE